MPFSLLLVSLNTNSIANSVGKVKGVGKIYVEFNYQPNLYFLSSKARFMRVLPCMWIDWESVP